MKKGILLIPVLLLISTPMLYGQNASTEQELTEFLHRFMKGASENDAQVHDRFWAEDLIYTSSSGQRFGKEQIMAGFDDTNIETDEEPASTYSAQDIQIQVYDDMAVVAFRLVGETKTVDGIETQHYLNSGTFVKRDGHWKVVNWQATKVPKQK